MFIEYVTHEVTWAITNYTNTGPQQTRRFQFDGNRVNRQKRIDIRPIDSLLLLYHDDNADSVEFMARNYGADRRTKTITFKHDCAYVTYVCLHAMKRKREKGVMDSIQLSIRNFRSFQAQMSRIV